MKEEPSTERHRRWSRDKAWVGRGVIRKRQKEGNTNRIFLGVSQLIDSLGFERKTARGRAGGELEVEMSSVRVTGPRWWVTEAGSRIQTPDARSETRLEPDWVWRGEEDALERQTARLQFSLSPQAGTEPKASRASSSDSAQLKHPRWDEDGRKPRVTQA